MGSQNVTRTIALVLTGPMRSTTAPKLPQCSIPVQPRFASRVIPPSCPPGMMVNSRRSQPTETMLILRVGMVLRNSQAPALPMKLLIPPSPHVVAGAGSPGSLRTGQSRIGSQATANASAAATTVKVDTLVTANQSAGLSSGPSNGIEPADGEFFASASPANVVSDAART